MENARPCRTFVLLVLAPINTPTTPTLATKNCAAALLAGMPVPLHSDRHRIPPQNPPSAHMPGHPSEVRFDAQGRLCDCLSG